MWPDLLKKAKEGGLDVVQTYVFWNGHEPQPGKVSNKKKGFFHLFFPEYFSLFAFLTFCFLGGICSIILKGGMI